jgi:hypothetical protein
MQARRAGAAPGGSAALSLLLAVVLVAACGPLIPSPATSPAATQSQAATATIQPSTSASPASPGSPAGSVDVAALYKQIQGQVVAIRGLQPKSDVTPQVLDEAQLRTHVTTSFKQDNPTEIVLANERLLKGLGLFPKDKSLETLYIDLLSSQIAGFYDPKAKQLFVLSKSGALGPVERVTFSHEYTHALQDQNFDVGSFELDAVGESDRSLGRLSLIEGDATTVMTDWAQQNLTPDELVEMVRQSLDPEAVKVLEQMPPILREPLGFPYDNGLRFVLGLRARGGWAAVNAAFKKPPASSEQIMHPEKYDAAEAPVAVALPRDLDTRMGAGWKLSLQDTLGEFQLAIWLREGVTRVPLANAAAAGWGGDRVALLDGPNGAWAIALLTTWDDVAEASEFADAAGQTLTKLGTSGTVYAQPDGKDVKVLLGSDAEIATKLDTVLGDTGT